MNSVPGTSPEPGAASRRGDFVAFVIAQGVSQMGSTLTTFGIGLWVLDHTERLTDFAWAAVAATVPAILLAPVNGILIDRIPRRTIFLAAQLGPALCALAALVLFVRGEFGLVHAIVLNGVSGIFGALNAPAVTATTSLFVARSGLVRANGALAASMALPALLSPAVAGFLMSRWGMPGVLVVDLVSFAAAIVLILRLNMPRPEAGAPDPGLRAKAVEVLAGFDFLRRHRRLFVFLAAVTAIQVSGATLAILAMPLLRSLSSTDAVGLTLTISSLGAVLGAVGLAAQGGPSRRLRGVTAFAALQGLFIAGIGLRPTMWLVAPCLFGANAAVAALSACSESILQEMIPARLHGRVFALRSMMVGVTGLAFTVLLGSLSDRVFEPLMRSDSPLAVALGAVLGHGEGRGVAVLVVLVGLGCVLLSALVRHPVVSSLEHEQASPAPAVPSPTV